MDKLRLKNSIFSRLVATFIIILIPVCSLAIYLYYWGIQTVKQEISKSTVMQQSFYLTGFEKEVGSIKILQYDCLNDENLNKLAIRWVVMDDYSRTESMRQLQLRLITIKNSSSYIKDVTAHILPIRKSISASKGLNSFDMEKFMSIRAPLGNVGAQIIDYKGGLYLSTMQDRIRFNELYMIEIELDREAMKQALVQFNTYSGSGSYLIDRNNVAIVSDSRNPSLINEIITKLDPQKASSMESINIQRDEYYIVYTRSNYLNYSLIRYIPARLILQSLDNFNVWVWLYSCVTIVIIVAYAYSAYKYMHKPMKVLVKSFHKVEMGDLQVSINHDSSDEFGYLYKRFNEMIINLNMLIEQVYKQKILAQRAELKQLQTQINPHFLYNSFFVLNTMALIGDDNLIPFTKQLGEYFRFLTRNASDFIPLNDEINHAKVYLAIQNTRFSKRLQTKFMECPLKFHNIKVPRLILQPILENAFEHGIEKKSDTGIIIVSFEEYENILNIIIEDNGNNTTDINLKELNATIANAGEESEITGILNIHRRLQLSFGEGSGLQVTRSELGGLKVLLKINICGSVLNE